MFNLSKLIKSVLSALCLAATLIPQLASAGHSSVFYNWDDPNEPSDGFSVDYPYRLTTTKNSSTGVSHGLTGNYLGPFGATNLTWYGLDNQSGKVDISFDLVLRGFWSSDTFSLDFSSEGGGSQSPVDNLISIAFNSPGDTQLPPGVTKLYEITGAKYESAYRIQTTTHAAYGIDTSGSSSWTLVFTGSPESNDNPVYNGTWGIDNLDIRWGAAANVPEPGSALFLIAALPLIAGMVCRRRCRADIKP